MKKFYVLSVMCSLFFIGSFGQSILNPSDTVITYNPASKPTQPAYGQIGKWVRTQRLSWNTTEYKCYFYKGNAFRLHFPKSYNPTANDGKKYPILVFFHGLGEADTSIYDNEYQLYHGGDVFQAAVDNGTFDGYVLCMQSSGFWGSNEYQSISEILDYMIANNKLDPFAISDNGLSAGGQGTWEMLFSHPAYIASAVPMSSVSISYTNQDTINKVKFTPVWEVQGGLDGSPAPYTAHTVRDAMLAAGADLTYTEFSTLGHDTWDSTWQLPDFWPYLLRAYSSNPWTLTGRTKFCPGDNINVTIGLPPGFQAYQWRFNSNLISGATGNSIQVTQVGTYDARVQRNGIWSDWSRTPVQIIIQTPSVTPPIQVAGLMSTAIPSADGKNYVNLQVSGTGSYISYTWKKVGSDSVYSTNAIFKATQPGYYIVNANQQYSCSSLYSAAFKVIDAKGPNAPSAVKSLVANTLSNTQVQLTWSQSTQQANAPTAFEIYRGTASGSYNFTGQVSGSITSFIDSALLPKTKYFYAIRAIDSTGAAALSNEASAATFSDTTAPSIPANLKSTYTTPSTISIAWTASTDNVAVDHYAIYVNGTLSNITKQTAFILTGLVQNQPYTILVKAVDGSNNVSSASNQITAEPILGGLKYSFYTTAAAWSVLPNFSALTPVATGVSANVDISVATQTTNFGFVWQGYINIPVSGTYTFQTTSDDGSALWFNFYTATGTPTVNNDGSHGSVSVTSKALTLTAGIYPICIEYFQGGGGYNMSVSWASSALFGNNTQRAIANTYFTGSYVNTGSVPALPNNVTAKATAYNKINVAWKDNSNNETGFEVYRSTSAASGYAIVSTLAANTIAFTDSTLSASTTYYYKIQAINKYGNSGLSHQDTTASASNGLNYSYYTGTWSVLPNFTTLTPVKTGVSSTTDISVATQTTNYGFLWQGYLKITKAGSYTFTTTSDDGSDLWINSLSPTGTPTVNNDGLHGATTVTSSAITLAVGTYPVCAEFFQQAGGASMSVTYKVPGTSAQVAIPNAAFYQLSVSAIPSATTLALPAAPTAPANFVAAATSASQISLTWKKVTGATGYQLLRSIGDTSNYRLLTTLAASAISFSDTGLNANLKNYYQIKATGIGGTLSPASLASATTKDNAPIISKLGATAVPYGTTTTIAVNATDADGDVLSYTTRNLPAFASIVNNGTNGINLILNPAQTNIGVYNNVTITANDSYGRKDSTVFTLTVNSNYPPIIDSIANYTLNENDSLNIPLSAHDPNSGDVLTFSVTNVPNAYTIINNSNGKATLALHPNYLAAGNYTSVVTVNDGNGGITSRQFNLTVKDVNPNTNIYTRFQYVDTIGKPWNSITGLTTNNLVDASGKITNVGLALQTSWFAVYNTGPTTGNNSGVYPDAVLQDYYYFGIFGGPDAVDSKITGLDTTRQYNLTFFAASLFPGTANNGATIYTVGSVSDTLQVQGNTKNTVTISNVKPAADGTITFHMSKNIDAQVGYLNALTISSLYDDGTAPAAATSLTAQNVSGKGVQLSWNDVAYNESGYNVYRSLTSNQVYTQVGQTQAGAIGFTDTSVSGNIQYSYKIAAYNTHGVSAYSNIATITTIDRIPQINAIADVTLKSNQTVTVNVSANDDTTDHITLSAANLPSFATFTDNGNGTGTITLTPASNNIGGFQVTVTATDNSDSSTSTSFNILISDPNIASTYLSFSDGSVSVPKPWTNIGPYPIAGTSFSNIIDDSNSPAITLTFKNGFQGVVKSGMQPVDGYGIYPNVIMRSAEYESSTNKDTIQLTGLSTSKLYNFVFFNSHDDGLNGTTNFTIGTQTVTLNATDNISKTVQINGITADATGKVYIVVSKATGADYAFISSMIIQSYANTYTSIAPANLRTTTITRNSIGLQWQDRGSTETGYQIYRAADSVSSYTLLATLAAGTTSYTDSNLTTNKTYNYAVRAVYGTLYSGFSNTVAASTYAYNVYLNYTASNNAPLPWNNLDVVPQNGYVWNNFFDEKGMISSTGMQLNTSWAGLYSAGINPLNNSGIYPDTVMIDSYGLYPGQTGIFQITGLNIGMKYNFTFFASSNAFGDVNVAYTINGVTTLLNTSLNVNGTETIYGVTPDNYGNVTVSVAAGTPTSQFGLIGALVIGGYTPSVSSVTPTLPASQSSQSAGSTQAAIAKVDKITGGEIKAYPNPFHDYFTLTVPAETNNSRLQVIMYDVIGKIVYTNQFTSASAGVNSLKITTSNNLAAGIYTVVVINNDTKTTKTIRLTKQ